MTATDLHQRMLHLLDRAKTMSAGDRLASRPAPGAITATEPTPPPLRPAMTEPTPMEAPVHYGPPVDTASADLQPVHPASHAPAVHVPDFEPQLQETEFDAGAEDAVDDADGRREMRQKVLRRGKITWQSGNFEIECQVRDLSSTGAKLRLAGNVTTPSCFTITIFPEKITKMAQVCWRDDLTLGVRFIED